jgi:hypothetical protein
MGFLVFLVLIDGGFHEAQNRAGKDKMVLIRGLETI